LREPPSMELGKCLEQEPTVSPELPEREVAERLASYNMLTLGVTDETGALLGAITVDDVLDRALPAGWRQRRTARDSRRSATGCAWRCPTSPRPATSAISSSA